MLERHKQRRAEIQARLNEIVVGARSETRTMTVDETSEYTTLTGELESLDATIAVEEREASRVALASLEPARPRGFAAAPAVLTKTTQAQRNGDRFKGETYTRYICARALAFARGSEMSAVTARFARAGRPELAGLFRRFQAADVAGGGTGGSDWGHELVSSDTYLGDFIEYLREKTVFDSLPLTEVPANVVIKGQDGTGAAYWVGEHKAIPMSAADFSSVTLAPLKVGALSAISLELVEDGSPSSLQLVAESLRRDSTQLIDSRFLSATAASAGVSPAGILNGLSAVGASAGTDINGLIADTDALVQPFITAKNTGGLVWVSRPGLAHKIAGFRGFTGTPLFPNLSEQGGQYDGKPYLVSDNAGSGDLLLVKPSDIFRIGDSGIALDFSREATLEFGTAPTGAGDTPTDMSENPVNLFQSGMVGIRVLRRINWAKRRASAVAWIDDAAYVPQIASA